MVTFHASMAIEINIGNDFGLITRKQRALIHTSLDFESLNKT